MNGYFLKFMRREVPADVVEKAIEACSLRRLGEKNPHVGDKFFGQGAVAPSARRHSRKSSGGWSSIGCMI